MLACAIIRVSASAFAAHVEANQDILPETETDVYISTIRIKAKKHISLRHMTEGNLEILCKTNINVSKERNLDTLARSKKVSCCKKLTRRPVVALTPLSVAVGHTRIVCTVTMILTFCDMPRCYRIKMRRCKKSKKYFRRVWKLNNSTSETYVAGSIMIKRPHTSKSPKDQTWWRDMSLRT